MKHLVKKMLFVCGVSVLLLCMASAAQSENRWVRSSGESCYIACHKAGMNPFASGNYKNGNQFYICAANAGGEGFRAGFNLAPSWDHACFVAYGANRSVAVSNYSCLCYR